MNTVISGVKTKINVDDTLLLKDGSKVKVIADLYTILDAKDLATSQRYIVHPADIVAVIEKAIEALSIIERIISFFKGLVKK